MKEKPNFRRNFIRVGTALSVSAVMLTGCEPVKSINASENNGEQKSGDLFSPTSETNLLPTPTATVMYDIKPAPSATPPAEIESDEPVFLDGTPEELRDYNGYRVVNGKIYNPYGEEMVFRGGSFPGFEWSLFGDHKGSQEEAGYDKLREWGFNSVRIPLNQVYWLTDSEYQERIDKQIEWANEAGLNVLLDLHRSGRGDLERSDQQKMPDKYSLKFWEEVGKRYEGNPAVMFELYNEPHDVPNDIIIQGGELEADGIVYEAVGMQALYDTIRQTGAKNIIIVNGNNWGFDHRGLGKIDGFNVVYGSHPYGHHEGKNTIADLEAAFGFLQQEGEALMITEFGEIETPEPPEYLCESKFYRDVISWAQERNISYMLWALFPDHHPDDPSKNCGFPGIIKNWEWDTFPTGDDVREMLQTPVPEGSVFK